jgi:peptide/nickel transport system ATP-binding protein
MMSPKTETVRHDDANEPNEKIVLRVSDLRVLTNAGDEILHGVDFALSRGEILGLVGESGSGKTTAGLACMGHFREGLKFGSGSVSIWPRGDATAVEVLDLSEVAVRDLRGSRIAYIPQDPALSLNPAMRVGEQIREVLDIHGFGSSDRERTDRVAEVLVDVGLPGDKTYQKRWPHQLSGGQQQRIGIAMAFAMYPDVLILDEPTTGLDVSTQSVVLDTIRQMTVANNVAGLYITHDLAVIKDISDRVAVMLRGDLVEEGPVASVLEDPQHEYTQMLMAAVPDLAGRKTIGDGAAEEKKPSEDDEKTHILVSTWGEAQPRGHGFGGIRIGRDGSRLGDSTPARGQGCRARLREGADPQRDQPRRWSRGSARCCSANPGRARPRCRSAWPGSTTTIRGRCGCEARSWNGRRASARTSSGSASSTCSSRRSPRSIRGARSGSR